MGMPNPHQNSMNLKTTYQALRRFLAEEDGPTAVEYAVMLGLILAVCIAAVAFLGTKNQESFDSSASAISGAVN